MSTIAIDAMGGDHGPVVTVKAALSALEKDATLNLILVGDESQINSVLQDLSAQNHPRLRIQHASETVEMDELPSQALRHKKDSSMRVAINLVKSSEADAVVSAGNTGALVGTSRFVLKTITGIDRPAIITRLPTMVTHHQVRMLDLGANVNVSAEQLVQFAVMGSVLTSVIDNVNEPKVALLNIGEEEIKGNEQIKTAAKILSETSNINFVGFIEGDAIFSGDVDVVVCDGFVGNVALKTMEGIAKFIAQHLRGAFEQNVYTRLAGLLAKPVLTSLKQELNPSAHNGATLIGLRGIVIKSHGGALEEAFENAISEAVLEVEKKVPHRIQTEVEKRLAVLADVITSHCEEI